LNQSSPRLWVIVKYFSLLACRGAIVILQSGTTKESREPQCIEELF
jgi:hypothetical protein